MWDNLNVLVCMGHIVALVFYSSKIVRSIVFLLLRTLGMFFQSVWMEGLHLQFPVPCKILECFWSEYIRMEWCTNHFVSVGGFIAFYFRFHHALIIRWSFKINRSVILELNKLFWNAWCSTMLESILFSSKSAHFVLFTTQSYVNISTRWSLRKKQSYSYVDWTTSGMCGTLLYSVRTSIVIFQRCTSCIVKGIQSFLVMWTFVFVFWSFQAHSSSTHWIRWNWFFPHKIICNSHIIFGPHFNHFINNL